MFLYLNILTLVRTMQPCVFTPAGCILNTNVERGWVLAYTCIIFAHSLYVIWVCLLNNTQNCIKILNHYFPYMDAEQLFHESFVQTLQFLRLHVAFAGKSCAWLVLATSQYLHKFSWQSRQKHFKHFPKVEDCWNLGCPVCLKLHVT